MQGMQDTQETTLAHGLLAARRRVFQWRTQLAFTHKLMLALGWAGLTGLAAQVKVGLPFTPVPMTLQTGAVLLAGILLGNGWGAVSMALYIVIGAAGVPWFAGPYTGWTALAGPTGGYLVGFILAAAFLGFVSDRFARARGFLPMLGLMLVANFALIHLPGLEGLAVWTRAVRGNWLAPGELLAMGVVPFLAGDLVKIVTAAAFVKAITPKEPVQ